MEIIIEPGRGRFNTSREYMADFARSLSTDLRKNTVRIPLSTGEYFFANGKVQRLPRGEVDARFVPKRGTINNTVVTPPSPARVPLRSIRVPKGIGAVLVVDYAKFLVDLEASQKFLNMAQQLADDLARRTALHDLDLMTDTLTAVQLDPQAAAARLSNAAMTRTTTRAGIKSTRIRGFSRT